MDRMLPRPTYKTIVYQENGTYFARDNRGNLLQSLNPPDEIDSIVAFPFPNPGNDPAILIQAALNRGGEIYIDSGTYLFDNDFNGLRVSNFSRINIAKDAIFQVPSGYDGAVFIFDRVQGVCLDGGFYTEVGGAEEAARNWTLLRLLGDEDANGCFSNSVQNIRCWYVGVVIRLRGSTDEGWVNNNRFSNFSVYGYRVGILFSTIGSFNRNLFENLLFQPHPQRRARTGARRISGKANIFLNVCFYDALALDGSEQILQNVTNISPEACSTLIIGGIMSRPIDKFVDNGLHTQLMDEANVVTSNGITPCL